MDLVRKRLTGLAVMVAAASIVAGCTEPNPFLDSGSTGMQASVTSEGQTSTSDPASTTVPDPTSASTGPVTSSGSSTTDASVGSTEPMPECPSTHRCVDPPPPDWSGPVARRLEDGEEPASCGGTYPTQVVVVHDDLYAPTPQCSCSCGNATQASCGAPTLQYFGGSQTCAVALDADDIGPGCTNLEPDRSSGTYWLVEPAPITGGFCPASEAHVIEEARFETTITLCEGGQDAGGCGDGLCMQAPALPYDGTLCVWRVGEHPCPAGYPEPQATFADLDDDRGCTECGCTAPSGGCSGTVTLRNDDLCGGQFGSGTISANGTCTASVNIVRAASWNQGTLTASCEETGGQATGAAEGIDPVTVCCTPAR